ncbi:Nitrogen fixation protein NifW [Hydrogenobaculum sp. SN]|nr:Nitrogen fixation protein NifW [Hydrogenobaculum sp. SN]
MSLFEDIKKLSSAEEFFDYFKIPYEEHILKPFRLHILQKFKVYIDSLSVSSEEEAY